MVSIQKRNINLEKCTNLFNVYDVFTVLDLTLVDLPGLTKFPCGDQPENIEKLVNSKNLNPESLKVVINCCSFFIHRLKT